MERIALAATLKPGAEPEARRLLEAGPPFVPESVGLVRHDVYLDGGTVVFVFEGPAVEKGVLGLFDDLARSAALAPWAPLLENQPRLAHHVYHWEPEDEVFRRIVVASDGSPSAHEAVEVAVELAAEHEAELTVVHVIPGPDRHGVRETGPAGPRPDWPTPEHYLPLNEAAELAAEHGVDVDVRLFSGHPVDEIVAQADAIDADLIVIGSRGRGRVAGALLGSISAGVLRKTRRPVLVVQRAPSWTEARDLSPA